jgi:hypothetical protein
MKQAGIVRYELVCGQLSLDADQEGRALYQERHKQHEEAKAIADAMGINSFFEESRQDGVWHLDGYVYAPVSDAVRVLQALKNRKVDVDIADVPSAHPDLIKEIEAVDWALQIEPFES